MNPQLYQHVVGRIRYMRTMGEPIEEQERLAKAYARENDADWRALLAEAQKSGPIRRPKAERGS